MFPGNIFPEGGFPDLGNVPKVALYEGGVAWNEEWEPERDRLKVIYIDR